MPPGLAKLATSPARTGSPIAKATIGIVFVAFLAAVALGVLAVKNTSTLVSITSAMRVGNRVVDDPLRTDAGIAPDGFAICCLQPLGHVYVLFGAPGEIRTPDFCVRSAALWSAELRGQKCGALGRS